MAQVMSAILHIVPPKCYQRNIRKAYLRNTGTLCLQTKGQQLVMYILTPVRVKETGFLSFNPEWKGMPLPAMAIHVGKAQMPGREKHTFNASLDTDLPTSRRNKWLADLS